MKILYSRNIQGQDYLSDTILHGLKSLENIEVVDEPRPWYMYSSEFEHGKNKLSDLYGKGFTIFGTLSNQKDNVDRTDIERKIKTKYFDLVIFSRIDPGLESPYLNIVLQYYEPNEIFFLDGNDLQSIYTQFLGKGLYFKRELVFNDSRILPISFSFPKEKIQDVSNKIQIFSSVKPTWASSHLYDNEQNYYNDYRKSLFGETKKKSGWDCLRHYEIIGCRCIPYFVDLYDCPVQTCTHLPKKLLLKVNHLINIKGVDFFTTVDGIEQYIDLETKIQAHFLKHCTTESMAKYILSFLYK